MVIDVNCRQISIETSFLLLGHLVMPFPWTFTYSMPCVPFYKHDERDHVDLPMDLVISLNHLVLWKLPAILPNSFFLCLLIGQCVFQFSSVSQSCPTLCDPINRSRPGLPVHHQLPEFPQTHVHRVGAAIQPTRPLSSPSPPASNPSQNQGLWECKLMQLMENSVKIP